MALLLNTRPAVVYRAFDADDRLLYIGSTVNLGERLRAHRYRKPAWRRDVARVDVEEFRALWLARAAEAIAIERERPLWNQRTGAARTRGAA